MARTYTATGDTLLPDGNRNTQRPHGATLPTYLLHASPSKTHPHPGTTNTANSVQLMNLLLNKLFTDDTGCFHPRARSGNQYAMVALHAQSNAILVQPFANKSDAHRIPAYNTIYAHLAAVNKAPTLHIMDNKASTALQQAIAANGCQLKLVPPHVH